MSNDFLDEGEKSIETDKMQTSIPLALLNLQYTSVKVIMPPSSLIKKSNKKVYVASLVSDHSLKVYVHFCYTTLQQPVKHAYCWSFSGYFHEYPTLLSWIQLKFRVGLTIESWMCSRILSDTLHTYNCLFIPVRVYLSVSKQSWNENENGKTW